MDPGSQIYGGQTISGPTLDKARLPALDIDRDKSCTVVAFRKNPRRDVCVVVWGDIFNGDVIFVVLYNMLLFYGLMFGYFDNGVS